MKNKKVAEKRESAAFISILLVSRISGAYFCFIFQLWTNFADFAEYLCFCNPTIEPPEIVANEKIVGIAGKNPNEASDENIAVLERVPERYHQTPNLVWNKASKAQNHLR